MCRLIRSVVNPVALIASCIVFTRAITTLAYVPTTVTVQGKLTDTSGNPISGLQSFNFKIFDAAVGGAVVWPNGGGENQSLNPDANGLWVGMVGAVLPLTDTVFADTSRWLEITVAGTTLPRVRLATGPYAHRTGTVDGASGGVIKTDLIVGESNAAGNGSFAAGFDNSIGDASAAFGASNTAYGGGAFVAGGSNDVGGAYSSVTGGLLNATGGNYTTVAGGYENVASSPWSFIGGGLRNVILGEKSFVGGGERNFATGFYSTVAGGRHNEAGQGVPDATVGGGYADSALGEKSTVGGGGYNVARGIGSTVPGGANNRATGDYSFAAGHQAKAMHPGTFVWADNTGTDFSSTGNNQFLVRAEGGVGIGTANPESKVDIRGITQITDDGADPDTWPSATFGVTRAHVPANNSYIGMTEQGQVAWGIGISSTQDFIVGLGSASPARTIPNPHLAVEPLSGHVGIATTDPLRPLHVKGSGLFAARFENSHAVASVVEFQNTSSGAIWEYGVAGSTPPFGLSAGSMYIYKQGTAEAPFVIGPTGSVNMYGYTSIYDGLYIQNGFYSNAGFTVYGNSVHNGSIYNSSGCYVMWNCPSDLRLKRDVKTLERPFETIDRLRGVDFEWRRDEYPERKLPEGRQIGLVAQEVKRVVPEAVIEHENGYLSVDYARLVPLLIEGLKEQRNEIRALKNTVDQQRQDIEALKRALQP